MHYFFPIGLYALTVVVVYVLNLGHTSWNWNWLRIEHEIKSLQFAVMFLNSSTCSITTHKLATGQLPERSLRQNCITGTDDCHAEINRVQLFG